MTENPGAEYLDHYVHVIEHSAYTAACTERDEALGRLDEARGQRDAAREVCAQLKQIESRQHAQLKHCRAAMTYAYEDHGDQYYLNVRNDIDTALKQSADQDTNKETNKGDSK